MSVTVHVVPLTSTETRPAATMTSRRSRLCERAPWLCECVPAARRTSRRYIMKRNVRSIASSGAESEGESHCAGSCSTRRRMMPA